MKLSFRKSSPRQHFQTLHQTAVTGPDCADWDRNVAFSEWHFTLMGSTALLQVVLHLTQPECVALGIALQIEINCTVLQWVGLDWTGQDRTGQDSTSRNWIVAVVSYGLGVFRMEIHCNVLAWVGLDWSERDKTVLDQRALHFAALNVYRLCLTSPDCITLHCFG